jgi:hypothetical protein
MLDGASLTLIAPGLGRGLGQLAARAAPVPQLAQLAARGALRYAWDRSDLAQATHSAWQRGLLWALQLEPQAHPSAALSALAHGAVDKTGMWLHMDPVHLLAGLNHLSLLELTGELQPSSQQRAALEPPLRQHLQACGGELLTLPGGGWLAHLPQAAQLRTVSPMAAAANELELAMPQGEGSAALRRMLTELQMLLHEHAVNRERSRLGLPEVNAVWLWGNGDLAPTASRALPFAVGDDAYLRGLYLHHGQSVSRLPSGAAELLGMLENQPQGIAVLAEQSPQSFEQEWLVPLVHALRARRLMRLQLILDGWHLSIDRRALRRFWRRPLPPGSWVA